MAIKIVGVVLMLGCLCLAWFGVDLVTEQHRKLTQFKSTDGSVISTSVTEHVTRGKGGRRNYSYSPHISYRYSVSGHGYTSSTVLPYSQNGSRAWAKSIASRFGRGRQCEVWYDPANPSSSYLLRIYAFSPYIVSLLAGLAGSIGLAMFFLGTSRNPPAPSPHKAGWYRIWPAINIQQRLRGWGASAAFATILAAAVFGHYFAVAQPYETASLVTLAIGVVFCGVLVFMSIRLLLITRRVTEAVVVIDTLRLAPGHRFCINVGQCMRAALHVTSMRVGLLCIETYRSGKNTHTRTVSEEWLSLLNERRTRPGDVLEGPGAFHIPPSVPPSTPSRRAGLPRFDWKLRMITALAGSPDYCADFPILVLAASATRAES